MTRIHPFEPSALARSFNGESKMNASRLNLVAFAVLATSSAALAAPATYFAKPLTAPGATDVYVTGVNNAGVAVGSVYDGANVEQAYVWKDGVATQLVGGVNGGRALGVNAAGQIVGEAYDATGSHAMLWAPDGTPTSLGTLGGTSGFAMAINDNGLVVGSSYAGNKQHAFVWTSGGGMVDYGSSSPNDANWHAGWNAVSNNGKLAGTNYRLFSPFHASTGQVGTIAVNDVSPPAQFSTGMALGVNDAGVVVGYQNPNRGSPLPAIFNADGSVTPLDTDPFGLGEGWAEDINNNGVIVGRAFGQDDDDNFQQLGFIQLDGQLVSLLSLVEADSGWTQFFNASSISDNGTMVGSGVYNGEIVGFIMTVVPEPTSLAALALSGVLLRRRRA
jgi:probable HAF family extracellular repeat protein